VVVPVAVGDTLVLPFAATDPTLLFMVAEAAFVEVHVSVEL
jgi:hypothetical protein